MSYADAPGCNPDSLRVITAQAEPAMAQRAVGAAVSFERVGYFVKDVDSSNEKAVFNCTATLKDTWAKMEKRNA